MTDLTLFTPSACRMTRRAAALAIVLASGAAQAASPVALTGAGSTFDYPLFSRVFYQYSKETPDVTVNYQSIGSGGGIEQFSQQTVDFGASDVPMNAKELAKAPFPVIQVPVALGGEGVAYNLPGVAKGLHLTGAVVADIFEGNITKWNDPAIMKLNPGVTLPDMPITVAHRSDGSGTTYIFTDYLSAVSPYWATKVGRGKAVSWPAPSSVGGKGNEGVAGLVEQTPGAIGYIELAYLLANNITYAQLQNSSGAYVFPTLATVAAAAASKPQISATNFSIVNAAGAQSYPISGYSWALLAQKPKDKARGLLLKKLFIWTVTKGQAQAGSIGYVPLPPDVQTTAVKDITTMRTN